MGSFWENNQQAPLKDYFKNERRVDISERWATVRFLTCQKDNADMSRRVLGVMVNFLGIHFVNICKYSIILYYVYGFKKEKKS